MFLPALAAVVLLSSTPQLIAPANHATDVQSPVAFEWSAVEGADGYRVTVIEENLDLDVVAETSRTTASTRLEPGTYAWFVEAFFDDRPSMVSETYEFDVARATGCADRAPVPLLPSNGTTVTSPVTFTWTAVPGAIAYEVSAALNDGEPVFVGETSGTSLTAHLGEGHVTWSVDAEFNGCDDISSEETSFDIPVRPACTREVPFPIAPRSGATGVPTHLDFVWTPVEGAASYNVVLLTDGNDDVRSIGRTSATRLTANVPAGAVSWAVIAELGNCPPKSSPISTFEAAMPVGCLPPRAPDLSVQPRALSGEPHLVIWTPGTNTGLHEVQEATREDFSDAVSRTLQDIVLHPMHVASRATRYHYRVRSLSNCGGGIGPWSGAASVVVAPRASHDRSTIELTAPYGRQTVVAEKVYIPGTGVARAFSAHADRPWLEISPSSGIIPPQGLDLTVTARPQNLPVGTSTSTILIRETSARGRAVAHGGTTISVPVSVSLVTPVAPDAGNTPLPTSLIVPVVAHAPGYESDVRIVNTSTQVMKYLLAFTPSQTDGTKSGRQLTIQIGPGETAALEDVLRNFFGFATRTDNVSGMLEIRPLAARTTPNITFASSRMSVDTKLGTLAQFIPAIPYSQFAGPGKVLSLQQIAECAWRRTNVGLVEASGERASVLLSVFDADGTRLGSIPIELQPGEHIQLNSLLQKKRISVQSGRIEVRVTSPGGKVSAYASVIDNASGDPMLVTPADLSKETARRAVLPDIAESEISLFNAGATDTEVTLATNSTSRVVPVKAGQMESVDAARLSGPMFITTPAGASVIATARVHGEFISAMSVNDGVQSGDRALQILQVEESDRLRTNLGIVELGGSATVVEISAIPPDSKISVKTEVALQPNEVRQITSVLRQLGLPATYNARITLRVVSGAGRISGYATLIDARDGGMTHVPAQ